MTLRPRIPQAVAFTALDPRIAIDGASGCWVWTRSLKKGGYGQVYDRRTHKRELTHRAFYRTVNGPVPEGLVIDHVCRVRSCVNPAHLRAVTQRENLLAPGSLAHSAKICCPRCGGPYRVFISKTQQRQHRFCPPCHYEKQKARLHSGPFAPRNREKHLAALKASYWKHRAARLAYAKAYAQRRKEAAHGAA